jgi:hypothetical protein
MTRKFAFIQKAIVCVPFKILFYWTLPQRNKPQVLVFSLAARFHVITVLAPRELIVYQFDARSDIA